MKNKSFHILAVLLALFIAASLLLTGCSGGDKGKDTAKSDVIKIRLAHGMAPGTNVDLGYEKFKELVEQKSNGRIKIEVFGNTILGNDRVVMESAQKGTLEIASASSSNMANFSPKWMVWDLPYITTQANQQKLYKALDEGELGNYFRKNAEELGFKLLMFSDYGYRNFATNKKPINKPSDLAGLKLRTTDSPVEVAVAKALGANPTPMGWSEVYMGLQQGTIDGEGNTFEMLYNAKHHEALKNAATTRHNYSMHLLVMNLNYFNKLPKDVQDILLASAKEALDYERKISFDQEEKAKQKFKDHGIQVTEISPEQLKEWQNATKPVYDQFKDKIGQYLIDMVVNVQK